MIKEVCRQTGKAAICHVGGKATKSGVKCHPKRWPFLRLTDYRGSNWTPEGSWDEQLARVNPVESVEDK
jgi:hypothetical protein